MDVDNEFCFHLNGFNSNMQHSWRRAQYEEDFYDVILACEDKNIQAHKLILSSSSPILKNIMKSYPNPQSVIYLMGIKYKDLYNLVSFMYQGEVNIEQDDLQSFIYAAEELQIEGIFGKQKDSDNMKSINKTVKSSRQNMKILNDIKNSNENNEFIPALNFKKEEGNITEDVKHPTLNETGVKRSIMQGVVSVSKGIDNVENIGSISESELENRASAGISNVQKVTSMSKNSVKHGASEDPENIQNVTYAGQDSILNTSTVGKDSIQKAEPEFLEVKQQKLYSCNKCEKLFNRKTNLQDHQLAAHEGVRYPCDVCEHTSSRIDGVRVHMAQVHEGVRYPCELCDYVAPRSGNLSNHLAIIHNKGLNYPCDKCDVKTASVARLSVHKATHFKQDKLPCGYCDRKFEGRALLNNHIAKLHKRVTYACDNCNRTFNGKGPLKYHINATHSNNL